MPVKIDAKTLWPAGLSLATATALVVFVVPDSGANRLSTLDVEDAGFDEQYLQFLDADRTRASIVDRGATTVRRGELPTSATEWSIDPLRGDGGWLARSPDEGVQFFVPVSEVPDWTYPLIYSFVRERRRGLELPATEWTALYVDRLYQGLFLRVTLPFDRAEAPARRELLTVQADRMASVDTWFEPTSGGDDVPSELDVEYAHGSLAWLASLSSDTTSQFILSRAPLEVTLMPLPVPVPTLFTAAYGAGPSFRADENASRWNQDWRAALPDTTYLAEVELEDLESAFAEYRDVFLTALRVHEEFHGIAGELQASLPSRQGAGLALGLTLGED